jgi:acetyltransferase-like isoleucine patch superfamily enzyme
MSHLRAVVGRATAGGYTFSVRLRNRIFTSLVSGTFGSFGRRSSISLPVRLDRPTRIHVGHGVSIGPACAFLVGHQDGIAGILRLEDGVAIAGNCTISAVAQVIIERDALLARNVYISDHNHAYESTNAPVQHQGVTSVAAVVIGQGAWLGQNVVITPGVTVGAGAVVAANSVVRDDVPPFTLAAGSPARTLRSWG